MKKIQITMSIAMVVILGMWINMNAQEKQDTSKPMHRMKHDHQTMHKMQHDSSSQHHMQDMKTMKDSTLHSKMLEKDKKKSPLIQEGEIDLNAIDKNKSCH